MARRPIKDDSLINSGGGKRQKKGGDVPDFSAQYKMFEYLLVSLQNNGQLEYSAKLLEDEVVNGTRTGRFIFTVAARELLASLFTKNAIIKIDSLKSILISLQVQGLLVCNPAFLSAREKSGKFEFSEDALRLIASLSENHDE